MHVQRQVVERHPRVYLLWDLHIVEFLLPFIDGLQAAQPDVHITNEDTLANMDGQTVERGAQVLQKLLNKAWIVVVFKNLSYNLLQYIEIVFLGGSTERR